VIIDDNLPNAASQDLSKCLKHHEDVLVLMLTGRQALASKAKHFWRRCDDFLLKSFDLFLLELEWRIKALLERQWQGQVPASSLLTVANLVIDPICREVAVSGQKVDLTPLEFDLLYCLANYPGQVWRREELIRQVWSCQHVGNPRIVDIHIGNLRKKLPGNSPAILTVKGIGYKLQTAHPVSSVLNSVSERGALKLKMVNV
jgi:DNA-binding response OmpR family regulator